jgi:hypothetical protein
MRKFSVCTFACFLVMSFLFESGAFAQNFFLLSGLKGCESVMIPLRNECNNVNGRKNSACEMQGKCDLDKQIEQIAKYKAGIERLNAGQVADADRSTFTTDMAILKADLDASKKDAQANERAARECVDARQAVYEFFGRNVIPDTERAASDANDRRKVLLEELDKAKELLQKTRDRRDELADADAEKDRERWDEYVKMRDEYEKNNASYREAEAKLTEFNGMYGGEIDRYADRLLTYYKSEQEGHTTAIEEQKTRAENCGKLEYLSYPEVPTN